MFYSDRIHMKKNEFVRLVIENGLIPKLQSLGHKKKFEGCNIPDSTSLIHKQ